MNSRKISIPMLAAAGVLAAGAAAALLFEAALPTSGASAEKKGKAITGRVKSAKITVIYDNNPFKEGLETDWGFSCLVELPGSTILFDTGGNPDILLSNMDALGIDPSGIDRVVLSHIHADHTGALGGFLEKHGDVTVHPLRSFPEKFLKQAAAAGARISPVDSPARISKGAFSTGELGTFIKEQALVIRTTGGLVVITGCAHPGVVKIVRRALETVEEDVLLVMGGFHLSGSPEGAIEKISSKLKKLGVKRVGPCHCSGDRARRIMKKRFGDGYVAVGVGKIIKTEEL